MNIIFLKVNIALFGYPSIFAVDVRQEVVQVIVQHDV